MPWECGPLLWWLGTWNKVVPWFWSQRFVHSESQILQKGQRKNKISLFKESKSCYKNEWKCDQG